MAQPGDNDSENYYSILQVDSAAEPEVIEAAYRALSKKYHPDRNATPDAQARMATINAAYAVIGNDLKRAEYDERRRLEFGIEPQRRPPDPDIADADSPFAPPDPAAPDVAPPEHFDRRARRFVYTYTPARPRSATLWRTALFLVLFILFVAAIYLFLQALSMSGVSLPFTLPRP